MPRKRMACPCLYTDGHRLRQSQTYRFPGMQKAPTVAIDVPLKALVWEDDQGKVWLTYNTADYLQNVIYPRHGLPSNPDAAKNLGALLAHFADAATQ